MFRVVSAFVLLLALAGCSILPETENRDRRPQASSGGQTFSRSPAAGQCLATLGKAGTRFSSLPDQYFGGGCSAVNSVNLSSLRSDTAAIGINNLGPVACPVANSFAGWARFGVDRAARQLLGSPLDRIETMGSYACRNIAGSSKKSAHSRAEAIDVSAFILADGRRISLTEHWHRGTATEREFLRIVFRSACKRFGTVLGPDYNAAHRDHFHLELGSSGMASGSFCR